MADIRKKGVCGQKKRIDLYSGGQMMPGRTYYAASPYRYTHNGHEREDEIFQGAMSAEYWMYDSRIIRRWEIDPLVEDDQSPYACFNGNPILYADPLGLKGEDVIEKTWDNKKGEYIETNRVVEKNGEDTYIFRGGALDRQSLVYDHKSGTSTWSKDSYHTNSAYQIAESKLFAQKEGVPAHTDAYKGAWGTIKHLLDGGSLNDDMANRGLSYNPDGYLNPTKTISSHIPMEVATMGEGAATNTVYKGFKFGLPYIGKAFNILKRYTKSERALLQIKPVLKNINDSKLLRAVEQRVLEYMRTLGKVANKNNAFNPKRPDYKKYMEAADKWLEKNAPDWKDLFTK